MGDEQDTTAEAAANGSFEGAMRDMLDGGIGEDRARAILTVGADAAAVVIGLAIEAMSSEEVPLLPVLDALDALEPEVARNVAMSMAMVLGAKYRDEAAASRELAGLLSALGGSDVKVVRL